MKKITKKRKILCITSAIYAVIMAYFLFFRHGFNVGGTYWEHISMNINICPFYTIRQHLLIILQQSNPYLVPYAFFNLLGNIIGFIPFGILLPTLFKQTRTFKCFFLYAVSSIMLIELIQLFTLRGSCDIDDLILNILGSLTGYGINQFMKLSAYWGE